VAIEIRSHREMRIVSEDDVVLVRRAVRDLAQAVGLNAFATAAITTATSELTRNALVHGGGGLAIIEEISDGRAGLRIEFRDEGPGIADVQAALKGGNSTKNSLGLGLYGSRRLVDSFQLETAVGKGTRVTIIKWSPF
jgi:serine/threonine-protein kinase RsbT